jgi:hypothetical protein
LFQKKLSLPEFLFFLPMVESATRYFRTIPPDFVAID